MGSPISLTVANLFMQDLEKKLLSNFPDPPRIWWRYVDDTLVMIRKETIDKFMRHINSFHQHIKFTIERESVDHELSFLDCGIRRRADGKLDTGVHGKDTHSKRLPMLTQDLNGLLQWALSTDATKQQTQISVPTDICQLHTGPYSSRPCTSCTDETYRNSYSEDDLSYRDDFSRHSHLAVLSFKAAFANICGALRTMNALTATTNCWEVGRFGIKVRVPNLPRT
ncbi:uncharacterized protein DEA37_0000849 [Paragonimus westermani]|uniref:Reverse transcriptase domain-containing protein n=1 Tax=Paragonimus westermani TaxID=34504 RepID=A0A5J4P0A6_9TREM|nr:uncharacterized protein DEA37_0000849 [Paragonimus westermani]